MFNEGFKELDKATVPIVSDIDWRLDICVFSVFHKHCFLAFCL